MEKILRKSKKLAAATTIKNLNKKGELCFCLNSILFLGCHHDTDNLMIKVLKKDSETMISKFNNLPFQGNFLTYCTNNGLWVGLMIQPIVQSYMDLFHSSLIGRIITRIKPEKVLIHKAVEISLLLDLITLEAKCYCNWTTYTIASY